MAITFYHGIGNPVIIPSDASELEVRQAEKRVERNNLLTESDWITTSHLENNEAVPDAWKTYRQELRDMDFSDPNNLTWPTKPE